MAKVIVAAVVISLVAFAVLGVIYGTQPEQPVGAGTLKLYLSDAPLDAENVTGVYITINEIQYHLGNQWITCEEFGGPQTYNLLELTAGNSALLGELTLPAGNYTQIRFMLDIPEKEKGSNKANPGCYIEFADNSTEPLFAPSGGQTGYKANGHFEVSVNGTVDVTADFDVRKAVVVAGSKYILKPEIKLIVNEQSDATDEDSDESEQVVETGTLELYLSDAPLDAENVTGVYITINEIQYHLRGQWITCEEFVGNRTYNLLELTGGNSTLLGGFELPVGNYTQIRFMLDIAEKGSHPTNPGCYIEFADNSTEPLFIPSGNETGYKAIGRFEVTVNETVEVTADFDVRKPGAVVHEAGSRYILKPTIKLIVNDQSGATVEDSDESEQVLETGTLGLYLSDGPIDAGNVTGVYITINEIQYHLDGQWMTCEEFVGPQTYNLLELTGGNITLLGEFTLPAGNYTQIRFILDIPEVGSPPANPGCYVEFADNSTEPLFVPSGNETGYKAIGQFEVPVDGTVEVTADFDVREAVVVADSSYILKPTIKLIVND